MDVVDKMPIVELTEGDFILALEASRDARAQRFDAINSGKYGVIPPVSSFASEISLPPLGEIEEKCFGGENPVRPEEAFPNHATTFAAGRQEIYSGWNLIRTRRMYVTHEGENTERQKYLYEEFRQIHETLARIGELKRKMESMDFSSKGSSQGEIDDVMGEIGRDLPFTLVRQLIPSFNARYVGDRDYNGPVGEGVTVLEFMIDGVTLNLKQNGTQWVVQMKGDLDFARVSPQFFQRSLARGRIAFGGKRHWTSEDVDNMVAGIDRGGTDGVCERTRLQLLQDIADGEDGPEEEAPDDFPKTIH